MQQQQNNPFQGVTLEAIVTYLAHAHGWAALAQRIQIKCFQINPSIKSSLTFLRKTPWARAKVEDLYLETKRLSQDELLRAAASPEIK